MTVVPKACGVTVDVITEATLGLDEVKVHKPVEFEVGGIRLRLPTLSFVIVISPNVPKIGAIATTVNFI